MALMIYTVQIRHQLMGTIECVVPCGPAEVQAVILGKLCFINLPRKALLSVHGAWRQERLISRITSSPIMNRLRSRSCRSRFNMVGGDLKRENAYIE
jgi:hypothetical protein